jgi:NAD+ synthase (glutamine-hydrolysing)
MKNLKIALGQMRVVPGQPSLNFSSLAMMVQEAKANKVDLIVFPELCITGYLIGDQFLDNEWVDFAVSFNEKIKQLSDGIIIVWGNVWTLGENPSISNNDSRLAKLNAALVAYNGNYLQRKNGVFPGIYPKRLFPNYRIFDDQRYFLPGREFEEKLNLKVKSFLDPLFVQYQGETIRFGLEVCEDMWDAAYGFSPSQEYLKNGVDLLINISASPWTIDKEKSRQEQIKNHAKVPFIFVNKVGADNNGKNVVLFDGGSMVFNPSGELTIQANEVAEPELLIATLADRKILSTPPHKLYTMLKKGIHYFDEQLFQKKVPWIVGLSGGVDSAVSTALLTEVIGKDRIYAYSLPTPFNREITKNNARLIAENLGIHFEEIPIQPIVDAFVQIQPNADSLTKENIQARVRGSVLMNLAAEKKGVVLNNGNKIEIALGYTTLYGDTIGALAPLGDLTKMQINELATWINQSWGKPIIPDNLIATIENDIPIYPFKPSAELKANQVDPMKWGYHDWLIHELLSFPSLAPERILMMYQTNSFPRSISHLIKFYGLSNPKLFIEDLEWILNLWNRSYFKRVQMPPNIIISKGAFGYDYREAQMPYEKTAKYLRLVREIIGE